MPTCYIGAEIEPREVPYWSLFELRKQIDNEIDRRAWAYLKLLGYEWWKQQSIIVSLIERAKIQVVIIEAEGEQNFVPQRVNLEVPLKQFEAMVPFIAFNGPTP